MSITFNNVQLQVSDIQSAEVDGNVVRVKLFSEEKERKIIYKSRASASRDFDALMMLDCNEQIDP
jgi:hypothetical protein